MKVIALVYIYQLAKFGDLMSCGLKYFTLSHVLILHSLHITTLSARGGWGGWTSYQKKVGLKGSQFLEGGCEEEGGGDLFQGGLQFLPKK